MKTRLKVIALNAPIYAALVICVLIAIVPALIIFSLQLLGDFVCRFTTYLDNKIGDLKEQKEIK